MQPPIGYGTVSQRNRSLRITDEDRDRVSAPDSRETHVRTSRATPRELVLGSHLTPSCERSTTSY